MRIFESDFSVTAPMTEFDLIRQLSSRFSVPDGVIGIGDDCAVMPGRPTVMPDRSTVMPDLIGHPTDTLVTTDLLAEGIHFLLDGISPFDLGYKSAAVNISDIAAMGGLPKYAFLSLALPVMPDRSSVMPDLIGHPTDWLAAFSDGFASCCHRYGVTLLGGDTSASAGGIFINVTLMGECPHGTALLRSGARPGDLICVTGTLGDSAAGLRLIQEMADQVGHDENVLLHRHCHPEPRVAEGIALRNCPGVHSMMDISDGIAADLPHILEASGVGATVDVATLPLSEELRRLCASRSWDPIDLALCGGEDYELLFTIAPGTQPPVPCTVIGSIESAPGLRWLGGRDNYQGFRHF